MADVPDIEQRFAEEKGKIKAESYQKIASLGGWSGGSRTFWAVSSLGAMVGAVIGIVAPFFPLIVPGASSLSIAIGAIPASVATFAAVGMAIGFSGGAILGRISGSNATVAEEQEKRLKEWTARQLLHNDPHAKIIPDAPKPPEPEKPLSQRAKDAYRTYINPRVGAVMTVLGMVGGLIMAAAFVATNGATGPIMPELGTLTGLGAKALTTPVVTAYTVGVMASFGALWALNFPKIISNMTHFFGNLLNGKLLGREWGPEEPKLEQEKMVAASPVKSIPEASKEISSDAASRAHVTLRKYESFQELIAAKGADSPDLLAKR